MDNRASDLAQRLGREAEAVCRHYLSNGRRSGRYWSVGDVANTPGRSLFVRLAGPSSGPGAVGRWSDAATGEHGDLLDLIAANQGLTLRDALREARRFLGQQTSIDGTPPGRAAAPGGSVEAAGRLWAMSQPIGETLAERYLANRGIANLQAASALRCHSHCYHRGHGSRATGGSEGSREAWPALLAKITDLDGTLCGVHRTWLDPQTASKAPVHPPRKTMGCVLGNGVRIGQRSDALAAGEGLETVLSLRMAMPKLAIVAALPAGNLPSLRLHPTLRRLYIAVDDDPSGYNAARRLAERMDIEGIEAVLLTVSGGDVNDALRTLGVDGLRAHLRPQLAPDDVDRLLG